MSDEAGSAVAGEAPRFYFHERLRVRYHECDQQNIVFNANYAMYIDVAFTEYLRQLRAEFGADIQAGTDVVVAEMALRFHAPARTNDWLSVGVRCARLGRTSLVFAYRLVREGDGVLIVDGEVAYICLNLSAFATTPIPDTFRAALTAREHAPLTEMPEAILRILRR